MYNILINEKQRQVSAKLKWIQEKDPPYEEIDWYSTKYLNFILKLQETPNIMATVSNSAQATPKKLSPS